MRPALLVALPATVVMAATLSACGGARSRPVTPAPPPAAPAPAAAASPAASATPVAIAPRSDLEGARLAEHEGRDLEALALFERVASTTTDDRERLAAQLGAARRRLSSDAATRDLRKAQLLLEGAERSAMAVDVPIPVSDLLQLLREVADLRAQVRAARAEAKSLEAEIAKKDEALRRVTSAVVGKR
jgi:hypothetical protein